MQRRNHCRRMVNDHLSPRATKAERLYFDAGCHWANNPRGHLVKSTLPYSVITASSNPEDLQPLKAVHSMQKDLA